MRGRARARRLAVVGCVVAFVAASATGFAQDAAPAAAPEESLLVRADSLLAAGDTLRAESLAAAAWHAARGRDVQTFVAADRFLMDVARARSAIDPLLAAERYDRLTGRAEAASVYAAQMERRREELRRTEIMLRARDVDSLRKELSSLPAPATGGSAGSESSAATGGRAGLLGLGLAAFALALAILVRRRRRARRPLVPTSGRTP